MPFILTTCQVNINLIVTTLGDVGDRSPIPAPEDEVFAEEPQGVR